MADYYSQHDPRRGAGRSDLDYETGSAGRWIWAALILVAVVALIALGSIGAGDSDNAGNVPAANPDSAAGETVAPVPAE